MSDLTDRQREIYEHILQAKRDHGAPPTRAEITEAFGFSSPNAAEGHLRAIAAKGYIELIPGSARGIRVIRDERHPPTQQFELPLIGRIAAGSPITAEQNVDTRLTVDPDLFRPRADFLHRVAGHSMKDAGILDGDIVGIHAQEEANHGQIIAAVMPDPRTGEDTITLKRYFRRGNKIVLKPENSSSDYTPIEIDLGGRDLEGLDPESQEQPAFRIAGLYAGLIRTAR